MARQAAAPPRKQKGGASPGEAPPGPLLPATAALCGWSGATLPVLAAPEPALCGWMDVIYISLSLDLLLGSARAWP